MSTVTDDGIYTRRLVRHFLRLISREPLNFFELVRMGGGAYPTEIQRVLHSMVAAEEVNEVNGIYSLPGHTEEDLIGLKTGAKEQTDSPKTAPDCMPSRLVSVTFSDPHPADYDWRYTSMTVAELAGRLDSLIKDDTKIALFGTPTLFPQLVRQGRPVALFERGQAILEDLRSMGFNDGVIEHDLFDPIANSKRAYDIVVADPPWYPDFYRAFILRSTELLQDEGLLLISVLPWLTRPSAIEDRGEILRFAGQAGFDLVEVTPHLLTYESPKFERVALALKGIDCGNWRAGDLFVFRRMNEPAPDMAVECPKDEPEWDEYRLGRRKVKLRRRPEGYYARFGFRPAAEDGRTFADVSRRSLFRSRIDLWTSDNLAYSVDRLEILQQALKHLECGESPYTIAEDLGIKYALSVEEVRTLANLLRELVEESD